MKKRLKYASLLFLLLIIPTAFVWGQAEESHKHVQRVLNSYGKAHPEGAAQNQLKGSTDTDAVKVPILIYHAIRPYRPKDTPSVKEFVVEPQAFEAHLQYLRQNGYTAISLQDMEDYFAGKRRLPAKPVVITFDDGWEDQYTYAFPLLKKYHDTATFYVFSNAIGKKYFLTWPELKEMDQNGMTVGGHTRTHPFLVKIKDLKQLQWEIAGGKQAIEKHLGKTIDDFAYPFGHYNDAVIQVVKDAGYHTARSTYRGAYHSADTLYTLTGYIVPDDSRAFAAMMEKVPVDRLPVEGHERN